MVTGAQAARAEQVRDLVGLPFQLGVGQGGAGVGHDDRGLVAVLAGQVGQVHGACLSCSISRCFIILPATERGSESTKVTDRGHL